MLLTRVLTVLVILPLFAAALLFFPQWLWALVLLPGVYIGAWEWGGLAGFTPPVRAGYAVLCAASAFALYFVGSRLPQGAAGPDVWVFGLSCAFWVLVAPFWLHGH